ncbi:amino acid transporter [Pluteus cervinus]|uniref:Amino acid transporter n=1 Tax=Pluteus cervinus TaxID=181527 RepID=A0ACD3B815_9AGAR|nr:amino acid transporter [Pluteus cervinus]
MFSFISRFFHGNLGGKKAVIRKDDALLAVLGYKSQFRREFSLLESMAFSFSIMGVCAAISTTWYFPLVSGGHAGMVWGWVIPSLPVLCIAASLAELTSSMPTSAGLYYFSAKMAPRRHSPLLSWITGWANVFGQIALVCSIDFTCAQLIATAIAIGSDGKVVLGTGATFGIIIVLLISHGIVCCSATGILARLTLLFSCVNSKPHHPILYSYPSFGTTIAATITLLVVSGEKGTRVSAKDAFTLFENHTGWRNNVWAFFLTFTSHAWCLTGYDGAAHISEEVSGAAKSAPIAIVAGVAATEFLGLMYLISTSFATTSVEGLLETELPLQIGQLYLNTLGKHGTLALWSCIIFVQWVNGVVQGVDASRVTFAFARDNGLPGSKWWKQINRKTQTPVNAVWLVMGVSALLSTLAFSSTALSSLAGATVVGLYTSYGMPILLRITSGRKVFRPGPFSLGRWWLPIGVVAVAWASFVVVLLMFPILAVTNADEMNYASAIVLTVFLMSSLSWIFSARHWFKGPIPNITDDDLRKYSDSDIVNKKFLEIVTTEVKEASDTSSS